MRMLEDLTILVIESAEVGIRRKDYFRDLGIREWGMGRSKQQQQQQQQQQ
jgi:hypothetical protein